MLYFNHQTSGPPLVSSVYSPAGIVVDEVGFVYVSNFAGVGSYTLTLLCIVYLFLTIITIE